jgi:hypothetical protein
VRTSSFPTLATPAELSFLRIARFTCAFLLLCSTHYITAITWGGWWVQWASGALAVIGLGSAGYLLWTTRPQHRHRRTEKP